MVAILQYLSHGGEPCGSILILGSYSTANVYGNADTTLLQVMRVVWQSVRTVCGVPGVTTYHGAYH